MACLKTLFALSSSLSSGSALIPLTTDSFYWSISANKFSKAARILTDDRHRLALSVFSVEERKMIPGKLIK
jgi:hypothetical protein